MLPPYYPEQSNLGPRFSKFHPRVVLGSSEMQETFAKPSIGESNEPVNLIIIIKHLLLLLYIAILYINMDIFFLLRRKLLSLHFMFFYDTFIHKNIYRKKFLTTLEI